MRSGGGDQAPAAGADLDRNEEREPASGQFEMIGAKGLMMRSLLKSGVNAIRHGRCDFTHIDEGAIFRRLG